MLNWAVMQFSYNLNLSAGVQKQKIQSWHVKYIKTIECQQNEKIQVFSNLEKATATQAKLSSEQNGPTQMEARNTTTPKSSC
jgi:archaellum component FlaF (FlaF/FlaG flagellin family)